MSAVQSYNWAMHVGFHCLFFDDGANSTVTEPDQTIGFIACQQGSVSLMTGVATGNVHVQIDVFADAADVPSTEAKWDEIFEASVPCGNDRFFWLHATSDQISDEKQVVKPVGPVIRMRVGANGRATNWDRSEPLIREEYGIQFWPEEFYREGTPAFRATSAETEESTSPDFKEALAGALLQAEADVQDVPRRM